LQAEGKRRWTLEGARAVMAEVRRRTEHAVEQSQALLAQREKLAERSPDRARIDARVRRVVDHWAREMEALGAEVKGLWLIDFDNGRGYYCWKWPEQELAYFHAYEEGFAGRMRIQ
jgi:hypothetical protein